MLLSSSKLLKKTFIIFFLILSYIFSYFIIDSSPSFFSVFVYVYSLIFLFFSISIFGKNKYDLAPIFMIPFYGVLLLSCYKVSKLQTEYNLEFASVVIIGSLVMSISLLIVDRIKIPLINCKFNIEANVLIKLLLILYIVLKVFIIHKTGFRLEALIGGVRQDGSVYVIPGISGLAAILQWTLLISFPLVNRRTKIFIVTFILVFSLLAAKRGDVVRVIIYLLLYYFIYKDKYIYLFKAKFKAIIILLFFLFIYSFSYLGDLRQKAYDQDFSVVELLKSNFDNSAFAWFFGYTGFNFEVLSRFSLSDNYYFPMSVAIPFSRGVISNEDILDYSEKLSSNRVSGFNASTFLGPMVFDMGQFFWIELLMFILSLYILIFFARGSGSVGTIIFIMSLLILCPFGNYFLSSQFYYAILFSSLLNLLIKKKG